MKWSMKRYERYHMDYTRTGRKKGYKATINYSEFHKYYFFTVNKDKTAYNSLWDNHSYDSEEACMNACEEWIDGH